MTLRDLLDRCGAGVSMTVLVTVVRLRDCC